MGQVLQLTAFVLLQAVSALVCFASSGAERRCCPLPFAELQRKAPPAPPKQPETLRLAAQAGAVVAYVSLEASSLQRPEVAKVAMYNKGKLAEERELHLAGRLAQVQEIPGAQGAVRVAVVGVATSPDGALVGLQGVNRLLVFRGEELVLELSGVLFAGESLALANDTLYIAPWADGTRERVLLYGLALQPGAEKRPLLSMPEKVRETRHLLLAPRADGKLWAVEVFTGEAMLLSRQGEVLRRWPAAPQLRPQQQPEARPALEATRAAALADATQRPPQVELAPVESRELVLSMVPFGDGVVAFAPGGAQGAAARLLVLEPTSGTWRCWELAGQAPEVGALWAGEGGVYLAGPEGSVFLPEALLAVHHPEGSEKQQDASGPCATLLEASQ